MADVVNRTTVQYLRSVNTPDYPTGSWIINPDLSALASVPEKYWKVVGDTVVEMTAGEKAAVDAAAIAAAPTRENVLIDPSLVAIAPGSTIVIANGRPAVEVPDGSDGWGAVQARWPIAQRAAARLRVTVRFILKATGTGTTVRIAARAKAHGTGDDSSLTWTDVQYADATISHTTLGEVFAATVDLDASTWDADDALALQVGRNGAHANDTCNQPIQVIGVKGAAV